MRKTHGLSRHPLYGVWRQMCARCNNPKHPMYRWYGQRGIAVCERWRTSPHAFMDDMGTRPVGATIERIDNDGPYDPANCRWATRAEQARNRAPMGTYMSPGEIATWKAALKKRLRSQGSRPRPERRIKPQPCECCGRNFVRWGGHRTQKYCSHACYSQSRVVTTQVACANCGSEFKPTYRKRTARFCTLKCSAIHRESSKRAV